MKFCYLILAYRFPEQLLKLVDAIYSSDSLIYIHLDAESDIGEFEQKVGVRENLHFLKKRIKCIWGHRSMIDAELLLLDATRGFAKYKILLSDQHYPVKSSGQLWHYLETRQLHGLVELSKTIDQKEFDLRINYAYFYFGTKRGDSIRLPKINSFDFFKLVNLTGLIKVLSKGQIRKLNLLWSLPKMPIPIKWGSQWWILSDDLAGKILLWNTQNPQFYQACKHRIIIDEFFFQSILHHLNPPNLEWVTPTFVKRDEFPPYEFPKLLNMQDWNLVNNLPDHCFFGRKFDYQQFPEIVDQLEFKIKGNTSKEATQSV